MFSRGSIQCTLLSFNVICCHVVEGSKTPRIQRKYKKNPGISTKYRGALRRMGEPNPDP